MSLEKIEDALAIISEHCEHYTLIAVLPEYPEEVQLRHSSPFVVEGLTTEANRLVTEQYSFESDVEYVWEDDDEIDEEEDIF